MDPVERVLDAAREADLDVRREGDQWVCRCPAHEDHSPSLRIGVGRDGMALLFCHAGCELADILDGLGIHVTDLFRERISTYDAKHYPYVDEQGTVLYEKVRLAGTNLEPIWFVRRPDNGGRWINGRGDRSVPFNLPRVLRDPTEKLYLVDGEADVEAVQLDVAATCLPDKPTKRPGGPQLAPLDILAGRSVVVVASLDEVGFGFARAQAYHLKKLGCDVRVVRPPHGSPGSALKEHLAAGGTLDTLVPLRKGDKPPSTFASRGYMTMADITPRHVEWLWPDLVPAGELVLLASDGGMGKSTIVASMIGTLTSGGSWPTGGRAKTRIVGLISTEDDRASVLHPRLTAAGATLGRVLIPDLNGARTPQTLEQHIRDMVTRGARVVFVDPLGDWWGAHDSHKEQEARAALQPLLALCHELGVTVVLVLHNNKNLEAVGAKKISGSAAIVHVARHVLQCLEVDGGRRLRVSKSNLGPSGISIRYDLQHGQTEAGFRATKVVWGDSLERIHKSSACAEPRPKKHGRAEAAVIQKLVQGPRRKSELAAELVSEGFASSTVDDSIKRLVARGIVICSEGILKLASGGDAV